MTHLQIVPRLRISGATFPFRPTPLRLNKDNFALGLCSSEVLKHGDLKYIHAET